MKKLLGIFIGCWVLACSMSAPADTVVVGGEDAWPPFAGPDGSGIGYDIVAASFGAVGVDVSFYVAPYKRVMMESRRGVYVAYFHADKNPGNEDDFFWPETPVIIGYTDYFHDIGRPLRAASEDQLLNRERIGLVHGWGYSQALLANDKIYKDWAPDQEKCLKKLMLKRVDAVVLWYARKKDIDHLLKELKLEGRVEKAFSGGTIPLYLAFSKRHPEALRYLEMFEKGLHIIKKNGVYDRILNR